MKKSFEGHVIHGTKTVILTPDGEPPVPWKGDEPRAVRQWAKAVLEYGQKRGLVFSAQALAYWVAMYFVDMNDHPASYDSIETLLKTCIERPDGRAQGGGHPGEESCGGV